MQGRLARAGEAGDFPLAKCFLESADAGEFADTIDTWYGRLLIGVDADVAAFNTATEQARQFEIGHEVEAAGQVVAIDFAKRAMDVDGEGHPVIGARRLGSP